MTSGWIHYNIIWCKTRIQALLIPAQTPNSTRMTKKTRTQKISMNKMCSYLFMYCNLKQRNITNLLKAHNLSLYCYFKVTSKLVRFCSSNQLRYCCLRLVVFALFIFIKKKGQINAIALDCIEFHWIMSCWLLVSIFFCYPIKECDIKCCGK